MFRDDNGYMATVAAAVGWIHTKTTPGARTRPIGRNKEKKTEFVPRIQELSFSRTPSSAPVRSGCEYISSVISLLGTVHHKPRVPTTLYRQTVDPSRVLGGSWIHTRARFGHISWHNTGCLSKMYPFAIGITCTKNISRFHKDNKILFFFFIYDSEGYRLQFLIVLLHIHTLTKY